MFFMLRSMLMAAFGRDFAQCFPVGKTGQPRRKGYRDLSPEQCATQVKTAGVRLPSHIIQARSLREVMPASSGSTWHVVSGPSAAGPPLAKGWYKTPSFKF